MYSVPVAESRLTDTGGENCSVCFGETFQPIMQKTSVCQEEGRDKRKEGKERGKWESHCSVCTFSASLSRILRGGGFYGIAALISHNYG
jgi:hypothetical protein